MTSTPQPNGIHTLATTVARPSPARTQSFIGQSQPQSANTALQANQPAPAPQNTAILPEHTTIPPVTRPNDARTIHLILASLGVSAYQERVPLQLLDFAYRYTAGVLGDAAHLAAEGYTTLDTTTEKGTTGRGSKNKQSNEGDVTLPALRLATSSRLGYQFSGSLPKQALLEVAEERNRIRLPDVNLTKVFGVRLPEERFILANRTWGLLEDDDEDSASERSALTGHTDVEGTDVNGAKDEEMGEGDGEEEDEDGEGYQAVFGQADGPEEEMQDV